jgi:predicted peptidase
MIKFFLLIFLFFSILMSFQLPEGKHELREQNVNYSLYVPKKLKDKMVLILHDEKETGRKYIELWSDVANKHNYLILSPHLSFGNAWTPEDDESLLRILGVIMRDYRINKVLLLGVSTGGYFAFNIAFNYNENFQAICNFMGPVMNSFTMKFDKLSLIQRDMPLLFVYGLLEESLPLRYAEMEVNNFRKQGLNVVYWQENKKNARNVREKVLLWFDEIISQ